MNIILWNCRGVTGKDTVSRIFNLIKTYNLVLVCLVETRADTQRTRNFCKKFKKQWDWAATPARGYSGGIIILWKKDIEKVTPICFSRHVIHLTISNNPFKPWIISIVYNGQSLEEQKATWKELDSIANIAGPWMILGDFNAIRTLEEKKGGQMNWRSGMKSNYFNSFIVNNNLSELKFSGPPFTWCNNQRGGSRIWARLDRILCNDKWLDDASYHQVSHLARCQSDHSPLLLKCWKQEYHNKKPFRFDNNWIHLPECHKSVETIWETEELGNPMHATSHRLHNLKTDLTKKCMGYSRNLEKKIKQIKEHITELESRECSYRSNGDIWTTLRPLYMKHQAYLRQHTTYWAQKSRLQWLQNGDCNTKYFHQMSKNHRNNNIILYIKNKEGTLVTEPAEI
ncbi:hypothetical protein J5N97_024397 [Dioscorea zingiberensis]|uniref:Endonuclease/exonuclease/phosphatase domain-containing protein n=1 Tax=Dioscorea zingiberensis TaxID=325984 RepID=A0A9D5C7B0_9LILI|nr:hypothetical protein J5N97_024397 [Dioscorea zingiberensis]